MKKIIKPFHRGQFVFVKANLIGFSEDQTRIALTKVFEPLHYLPEVSVFGYAGEIFVVNKDQAEQVEYDQNGAVTSHFKDEKGNYVPRKQTRTPKKKTSRRSRANAPRAGKKDLRPVPKKRARKTGK